MAAASARSEVRAGRLLPEAGKSKTETPIEAGKAQVRAGRTLHEDMRESAGRLEEIMTLHRDVATLRDA